MGLAALALTGAAAPESVGVVSVRRRHIGVLRRVGVALWAMRLGDVAGCRGVATEEVLPHGHQLQVVRVHAEPFAARVTQLEACGDLVPLDFVGEAVSEDHAPVGSKASVAVAGPASLPKPAPCGLVHLRPEALIRVRGDAVRVTPLPRTLGTALYADAGAAVPPSRCADAGVLGGVLVAAVAVGLGCMPGSDRVAPQGVLAAGDGLQVVRVDAVPGTAEVVQDESVGNGAEVQLVRPAVCGD